MRVAVALLVVLVALGGTTPVAGTPGNDPPVVDAGLDQRVQRGGSVLLDGTASFDRDGEIRSMVWNVEAPNGTTVTPDCPTCERTSFDADQLGTYHVTLTVTDDDGATATDRLEVLVVPEPRPTVRLSGPDVVGAREFGRYVANASIDNESLAYAVWTVDGRVVATRLLSGQQSVHAVRIRHTSDHRAIVRATVYDVEGHRGSAELAVHVLRDTSDSDANETDTNGSREIERPPWSGSTAPSPADIGGTPRKVRGPTGGGGGDGSGTVSTTPGARVPPVTLNGARRTTWLVKRDRSSSDGSGGGTGIIVPTGWSPGGGASGAALYGQEGEDSTEYVNVLSHTTMALAGRETAATGESASVTYVGLGSLTRGGESG